jgi:PIN domain nuclease of toxin-antitoxin system
LTLLVDTNVIIWWFAGSSRVSTSTRALLNSSTNSVFASAASIWEIAIKASSGRLVAPTSELVELENALRSMGWLLLDITPRHALHVATLPWLHRDPFDRLIVAQAQLDGLTIVTSDVSIPLYQVATLPC